MTKQHFIALADMIRGNRDATGFTPDAIMLLSYWCAGQNPRFNRERWLGYIAGECGKNGGKVKHAA